MKAENKMEEKKFKRRNDFISNRLAQEKLVAGEDYILVVHREQYIIDVHHMLP